MGTMHSSSSQGSSRKTRAQAPIQRIQGTFLDGTRYGSTGFVAFDSGSGPRARGLSANKGQIHVSDKNSCLQPAAPPSHCRCQFRAERPTGRTGSSATATAVDLTSVSRGENIAVAEPESVKSRGPGHHSRKRLHRRMRRAAASSGSPFSSAEA